MTANLVYLADGREIRAEVQRHYNSGTIDVDGHAIIVERLARPYEFLGYGELVPIKLKSGETWGAVLQPQEYQHHVATVDVGESELEQVRAHNPGDVITSGKSTYIMVVYDQATRQWREMTDEEMGSYLH
jgi:hypothetical protein